MYDPSAAYDTARDMIGRAKRGPADDPGDDVELIHPNLAVRKLC
jgi:hypothetical protein